MNYIDGNCFRRHGRLFAVVSRHAYDCQNRVNRELAVADEIKDRSFVHGLDKAAGKIFRAAYKINVGGNPISKLFACGDNVTNQTLF